MKHFLHGVVHPIRVLSAAKSLILPGSKKAHTLD